MSIKTYDSALGFLPENRQQLGVLARLVRFFAAIGDGMSAAAEYERLVARGMQPGDAARKVFDRHYQG
jgi:hypothetical protein